MAKLHFDGLNAVEMRMARLAGKLDAAVEDTLKAGAEKHVDARKGEIRRRGFVDSGAMLKGVKARMQEDSRNGNKSMVIYSAGKDKHGVRNAEKEYLLHYGVKGGRSGQRIPSSHWVDEAERKGQQEAAEAMEKAWEFATKE